MLIGLRSVARRHAVLLGVLLIAAAVRVAVAVAYRPALFFDDSWGYGMTARFHSYAGIFVPGFEPVRPSGYPLVLDALALVDRGAGLITSVQHVAGLVVGVIAYALCRRLGASRWLSALATGVVVLDSYAIALEQHILSETFFGLTLLASLALLAHRDGGWVSVGFSGLLLAFAVTIRSAGVFAIPVWLIYLVFVRRDRRPVLAGIAALIVPLMIYAAAHAAVGRGFQLTETGGWFLYGRAGELADCKRFAPSPEERPLCRATPEHLRHPLYFVWDRQSPAQQRFGEPVNLNPPELERAEEVLRGFALKVIRSRPADYAEVVATDLLRFFVPGRMSPYGPSGNAPILFPERARDKFFRPRLGDAYFAVRAAPDIHPPSAAVREYQRWIHTPRWLFGAWALAGVLTLLLGLSSRLRPALKRRPEVFLLMGSGLAILLGTVATAGFSVRYLVPLAPLFVCGGIAAALDLAAAARASRITGQSRRLRKATSVS